MTPLEQMVQTLEFERLRPTPPPPAQLVHSAQLPVEQAPELDVRRLVREVVPRLDACELARRKRLRLHADVRGRVLTDVEIEAI